MEASEKRQRRVELLATILLAIAAVSTAWSTYQSTRWRGLQASNTSKATAARIESSAASTRAGQLTQIDIGLFTQWVNAYVAGNTDLANFYQRRFRDEFRPAFNAWVATNPRTNASAPLSPFAMPEYQVAEAKQAQALNVQAGVRSDAAAVAVQRSDNYMLAVVLFAASLFFAGISSKLQAPLQREALFGLGVTIFLCGVVWVATLPINVSIARSLGP